MKNTKRSFFKFSLLAVVFLVIVGCNGCKTEPEVIVSLDEVEDVIITDDQARTRFNNYGEHRGRIIEVYENNGRRLSDSIPQNEESDQEQQYDDKIAKQNIQKGFVPVQYTDYDFEKFKKYLRYIEQQTKKAGADISTLRIYFANYPADDEDLDRQRRNTVMFVPTINVEGQESAYYISEEPEGLSIPFLLTDSLIRTERSVPPSGRDKVMKTEEASLFPNAITNPSPTLFFTDRSVIGNEGGRNPPANN